MKQWFWMGAVMVVALTQTGCATQVKSLPFAASAGQSRGEVQVYFGDQNHQPVKARLGEASYSVRIARKVASPDEACHLALQEAVRKLREAAVAHHANAVIDVSTRFHDTVTNSSSEFTCGVSPSAAAIAVRGQLVVLDAG
jgi:uncharacterized protein YbjQ (UPF0145 family)